MAWLWAIIAIVLLIVEMTMGTFYFLALAASASVTALAVWLGVDNIWAQIGIMAVSSVASLFLVPAALRRTNWKTGGFKNVMAEIIGQRATVIQAITPERLGIVKLAAGSEWSATADESFEAGDAVRIQGLKGNTAIVVRWRQDHEGPAQE